MEEELEQLRNEVARLTERNHTLEENVAQLHEALVKPQSQGGGFSSGSGYMTNGQAQTLVDQYLNSISITGGGDIIVTQAAPGRFNVTSRGAGFE